MRAELPFRREPAGLCVRGGDNRGSNVRFPWIDRRAVENSGRDVAVRAMMPAAEMFENCAFDRAGMKEPNAVNRALLAETIDAADALFEAQGIPRQLDIDHEAASVMQIEPLAGGISRNQDIELAIVERI